MVGDNRSAHCKPQEELLFNGSPKNVRADKPQPNDSNDLLNRRTTEKEAGRGLS